MNNNGKISRFWMSLIGILFCVSGCKADDDFTFEILLSGKTQNSTRP